MTQIPIYSKTLPRIAFFLALLSSVIMAGYLLSSTSLVYSQSGSSTSESIARAVCNTDERSQATPDTFQDCVNRVTRELDNSCNSFTPNSEAWRQCRQRFLDDGTGAGSGSTSVGSFDGDCDGSLDPEDCGITAIIRLITDALLVLVGIVVVMMVVVGGIQYSAAGSNPQAVAAAKKKISQALLALVIYLFMGAFLQWLIPGGLF